MTHLINTPSLSLSQNRIPGKILVVEDEFAQRLAYTKALQKCGFQVVTPKNIKEVRKQAQELGDELAVALLDMRLIEPDYEDPNDPGLTGADLGLEIRKGRKRAGKLSSQQFVICSAWPNIEYYKSAVQLGVAAYLLKDELIGIAGLARLVSHIRALYLRWAIETDCLGSSQLLKEIAFTSRNQEESIVRFCQEIIAPRLEESLGAPFVILLTDNKGTKCCAGSLDIPQGYSRELDGIQLMTFVDFKGADPFILNAQESFWRERLSPELSLTLDGAAFIPFSIRELRLTLGILKNNSTENQFTEDVKELGKTLVQFFNPTLIELIINLLSEFYERSGELKGELQGLAKLCSMVGQEQLNLLSDLNPEAPQGILDGLQIWARDLLSIGTSLMSLSTDNLDPDYLEEIQVAEFITALLEGHLPMFDCEIHGDCTVIATREDLYTIVSRMLQWFERQAEIGKTSTKMAIYCSETKERAHLIFEDQSWRLPKPARNRLFAPFTYIRPFHGKPDSKEKEENTGRYLSLYLAGKLVEIRYKGRIEDRTDELAGEEEAELGHRFVLTFPKNNE
ncbi:MAG: response regulator [Acidobacteria bacterium]|nr:response regulator [Acidobacteriota bacterium]